MPRTPLNAPPHALLAFGRQVTASDAFDELVAAHGWRMEAWRPTFIDAGEEQAGVPAGGEASTDGSGPWDSKQILRLPRRQRERPLGPDGEPRLMVASAAELPSLYFVEWHYIDFVLSCVGNVSETARVLGIRRSTLQRKRKKNPPDR
jgi:hypothetical protein